MGGLGWGWGAYWHGGLDWGRGARGVWGLLIAGMGDGDLRGEGIGWVCWGGEMGGKRRHMLRWLEDL